MKKLNKIYESPVCTCTQIELLFSVCHDSSYGDYLDYTGDQIVVQSEEDGWEF